MRERERRKGDKRDKKITKRWEGDKGREDGRKGRGEMERRKGDKRRDK